MKDASKLYKYHSANCARIEDAIKRIELHARHAVATQDTKSLKAILPLYNLLIGASAETHLLKIVYAPGAFDPVQRDQVLGAPSHLERWKRLIDVAFRTHHHLNPKTVLTQDTLPIRDFHIYCELTSLLDDQLRIIVEMRNKLAHGQWEYPLRDDLTDVLSDKKKLLDQENLLSLKLKRTIITNLLAMIRDLAVSHATLYRDFNVYYNRLRNARRSLARRSYEKYSDSLVTKLLRGREKRDSNYRVLARGG